MSQSKVIVIADDFTGAAEVAGAAFRYGLTAEVHVAGLHASQADVVVVDADSRALPPDAAAAVVSRLTDEAILHQPTVLFKKVDSLLRGSVLAEIEAMRRAAGLEKCLLVCGNPRKSRTVVNGVLHVNGVPLFDWTQFALDPEHPRWSSRAIDLLLGEQCALQHSLHAGLECPITVVGPGELAPSTISIGDVSHTHDLDLHADRWFCQQRTTLAAGGAEFFEAVLRRLEHCRGENDHGHEASIDTDRLVPFASDEALLISGTSLARQSDWPTVHFSPRATAEKCAESVCHTLAEGGRAAMRAIDLPAGSPESRIERLLDIASHVLTQRQPSQVWIEGGRTASSLMLAMGYRRLTPVATPGDGIVALRAVAQPMPLYIIKPGSYPWHTNLTIHPPLTPCETTGQTTQDALQEGI